MRAFSVSSIYISNLITKLNLILVIVILAFVPNPVPISIFNITKYYNAV